MCGIVGFVSQRPLMGAAKLKEMREQLLHRGPDGCGLRIWNASGKTCVDNEPGVMGLAHRRLSIIDLSDAGAQPMSNEDGSIWITYNGEFYNYQDYREELERAGHVFRSQCDTEMIIHLYEEYGLEETLERMNGMFAFAILDYRKKILFLARDRVGQKPLYFITLADGAVVFASEIKALLTGGMVNRERLDPVAMEQFWTFGYTMGDRTIYEQIRQLPAGNYATWHDGSFQQYKYWDCPFGVEQRRNESLDDLTDELEALLSDAIRLRLISDVPLGVFLSGGVDSSLVAALTSRVVDKRLSTYTIAFKQAEFDESKHACAIAEHLGVENHVLTVDEELSGCFDHIVRQFDEPFGDSSSVPTFFVSKLARQYVTVALTGDGGDELFAGYPWYNEGLRLWGASQQRSQFSRRLSPKELLWCLKLRCLGVRHGFPILTRLLSRKERKQIFSDAFLERTDSDEVLNGHSRLFKQVANADILSRMQHVDLHTYLGDDILVKVDRTSMANSLECRNPLLDYRVIEFASSLPFSAKFGTDGRGKKILRNLLARYVPEKLFDRPKQGFIMPWTEYCQNLGLQSLQEEWEKMQHPWFREEAMDMLFPQNGNGKVCLQWNAFAMENFFLHKGIVSVKKGDY